MSDLEGNALIVATYLYENKIIAPKDIVVAELRKSVGFLPDDFDTADSYLLENEFIVGTGGGEKGSRWLTSRGVDFVSSRLQERRTNSTQSEATSKRKWSREAKIALVIGVITIVLAIIAIVVSVTYH
jgi:hypothetical protein